MLFRLSAERKVFLLKGDIPRSAKIASHVMPSNQRGLKVFYHALHSGLARGEKWQENSGREFCLFPFAASAQK